MTPGVDGVSNSDLYFQVLNLYFDTELQRGGQPPCMYRVRIKVSCVIAFMYGMLLFIIRYVV